MTKQLLTNDFINESLRLITEAEGDTLPNGQKVIKFRGIFSKCDEENGNGRVYSVELWDNVLKDPKVLDKLNKKTMLGELRHPSYRDIDPERSAFIVTKLWREGKYIMGEGEVLDNPYGPGGALKVMLRHGVQIGVSSRGEGSLVERGGRNYVDESDYELITFDMTVEPSVEEAFPKFPKIVESTVQKELRTLLESSTDLNRKTVALIESLITDKSASKSKQPQEKPIKENAMPASDANQMKSVVSRLRDTTTKLTESNQKVENNRRTILALKTRIAEMHQQKLNLAAKADKLVEQHRTLKRNYGRALTLAEGIRKSYFSLKETATKRENLLKRSIKNRTRQVESRISEKANVLKTKNLRLEKQYAKSLSVIAELTERLKAEKAKNARITRKYSEAVSVLEQVEKNISESKVKQYLNRELASVGGYKAYASLLGSMKNLGEAKKKVAEIKRLAETRKKEKASSLPFNEGLKTRTTPITEKRSTSTSGDSSLGESVSNIYRLTN